MQSTVDKQFTNTYLLLNKTEGVLSPSFFFIKIYGISREFFPLSTKKFAFYFNKIILSCAMRCIIFFTSLILFPLLMNLIDRRIKGTRSVLFKFLSMVVVTSFILLGVYFYGQQILATFRINMKSLTSMKAFFSSRLLMYFIALILVLFVACKFIYFTFVFKTSFRVIGKAEKTILLISVVFDLALIPNIFVNSTFVALFVATSIVEIGLVVTRLVFSIPPKENAVGAKA